MSFDEMSLCFTSVDWMSYWLIPLDRSSFCYVMSFCHVMSFCYVMSFCHVMSFSMSCHFAMLCHFAMSCHFAERHVILVYVAVWCHTADIIMLLGHFDGYKSALCNLTGCHSAGYPSTVCHSSQRTSTICKDIFLFHLKMSEILTTKNFRLVVHKTFWLQWLKLRKR